MHEMSWEDKKLLFNKITSEYSASDRHTQNWRDKMQSVAEDYLLPERTWLDKIKDRSVLVNLNIRLAVFVADDIQVKNVPQSWQLGRDIAENCDKVFSANFHSMDIREKYRDVIYDDALYWAWVLAVDGWNDHDQEPIVSYIDPRLCYPDPKNWQGSKMRYFGTRVKKNYRELINDDSYDREQIEKVKLIEDTEQKDVERANNSIKNYTEVDNWDDLIDLYNHITIFREKWDDNAHVYLVTLWADRSEFVRLVKMRPINETEKADPSKVDLWVKIFRGKPLKGSFAGISLIDDIGQYQDINTLLTNLTIRQAKEAGLWGKTFIDTKLWVDLDDVSDENPEGSIIPFTSDEWITAQNGIYQEPNRPQNPVIVNTIDRLNQLKQQADPASSPIAQWVGTPGSQTKAEIQTLQQNINQVLWYMQSNYMESLKSLRESIYKSYARNMSSQRRKEIVVVDELWNGDSYGFKKNEFISNGNVYILIKSKKEEDARDNQDFAKILSIYGSISQKLDPNSSESKMLDRMFIDKGWIKGLKWEDIVPLTADERQAWDDVIQLNQNKKASEPEEWQDHNVFINIYKKWLDTTERRKALIIREDLVLQQPKQQPAEAKWGWVAQQLWASLISAEQAQWQEASLAQV